MTASKSTPDLAKDGFYTVIEFAKLMKVNPRTVHRWIERGVIPAVQIELSVRIPASTLADNLSKKAS